MKSLARKHTPLEQRLIAERERDIDRARANERQARCRGNPQLAKEWARKAAELERRLAKVLASASQTL